MPTGCRACHGMPECVTGGTDAPRKPSVVDAPATHPCVPLDTPMAHTLFCDTTAAPAECCDPVPHTLICRVCPHHRKKNLMGADHVKGCLNVRLVRQPLQGTWRHIPTSSTLKLPSPQQSPAHCETQQHHPAECCDTEPVPLHLFDSATPRFARNATTPGDSLWVQSM
jgi:hypothetical protein